MRKWHRWLSVLFGVFLLWIAVTGVLSQIVPIVQRGGFDKETRTEGKREASAVGAVLLPPAQAHEEDEAKPKGKAAAAQQGFVCPADMTCRPKPQGTSLVGLLHHLHSGESFGPLGIVISTLSGLALVFFAFSGLWMYISMWRGRKDRSLKPGWFWQ